MSSGLSMCSTARGSIYGILLSLGVLTKVKAHKSFLFTGGFESFFLGFLKEVLFYFSKIIFGKFLIFLKNIFLLIIILATAISYNTSLLSLLTFTLPLPSGSP